jgi:hypothetical protein
MLYSLCVYSTPIYLTSILQWQTEFEFYSYAPLTARLARAAMASMRTDSCTAPARRTNLGIPPEDEDEMW